MESADLCKLCWHGKRPLKKSFYFDGYQIPDWRNFAYNLTSTKYDVCSLVKHFVAWQHANSV